MDDMDADLFGSKRKPGSAPAQGRTSKPGEKTNSEFRFSPTLAAYKTVSFCVCVCGSPSACQCVSCVHTETADVKDRKPSSAPAAAVRGYRKFSFMGELHFSFTVISKTVAVT